jgi:hypothetical protein
MNMLVRSSVRDYEPWADRKKQLMMPVFDDCIIYNDNLELAQRYVLINRYNNKRLLHVFDIFLKQDLKQKY